MTTAVAAPAARPALSRRSDRLFYTSMAAAIALTVFAGFARTYYLKGYFASPALPPLRHFHGLIFTSWVLLFICQTALVAARRTDIHRRLGIAGAILAATMIVVGVVTAIDAARRGSSPPGIDPLAFLIVPIFDMVVFGILVGAAVWMRRRTETHKRLMLAGTISLVTAAVARLPGVAGPIAFFALTDVFLVPGVVYDLRSRGRIHPAYVWGGLLLIASQPLRLALAGTSAWLSLAASLAR